MSYNGNVFYTVTSDDLTGAGSSTDPYVVHSTNGFLYLTNNKLSKITLNSKYIELNNNIVLNDERFNEDGQPSGGDRVVYSWKPLARWEDLYFNGKGHIFDGLYYDCSYCATEDAYIGFVSYIKNSTIQDISFRDVYMMSNKMLGCLSGNISASKLIDIEISANIITSSQAGGFIGWISSSGSVFSNLIFSGSVKGGSGGNQVGGIAGRDDGYVTLFSECKNYGLISGGVASGINRCGSFDKCKNYGKIIGYSNSSGVCFYTNETVDCLNYGEIYCENGPAAGITNRLDADLARCSNYGKIVSEKQAGGVVYNMRDDKTQIIDSKNHGMVVSKQARGAGIVSYARGFISNCMNYGYIDGGGDTIGGIAGASANTSIIANCINYGVIIGKHMIVGGIIGQHDGKLQNVENHGDVVSKLYVGGICGKLDDEGMIKNAINLGSVKDSYNNAKSLIYGEIKEGGIIINTLSNAKYNGKDFKVYIGSNFSGFYFSWKTGKVGIVALDGRGSFQGKIDEEWLKNKGYEKKEL